MSFRKLPLHGKILLSLLLGAVVGTLAQSFYPDQAALKAFSEGYVRPVGDAFMRMIFMIVVPLLFSALTLGVCEIGDARKVGRVGVYSLLLTLLLSGTAVVIGVTAVNWVRPGDGISTEKREELLEASGFKADATKHVETAKSESKTFMQVIVEFIPRNPLAEANRALEGGLLPLMFFTVVFGLAMNAAAGDKVAPIKSFMAGLFEISLKVIEFAMKLAPIGVFALIFHTTAIVGLSLFLPLGKYVAVVLATLALHQFGVYSLALKFIARRNPLEFFRQIRTVMLTAFATSSSNATLPTALRSAEVDVGLPRNISSFVLTVGATANQNGTALFEGVTVLFLAQLFGGDLSLEMQFQVMGLAILAGVGTAGVPGGAWPMIALIVGMTGAPPESIAIVLGIDRILDMSRTVLNVTGDITIAACVTRLDGGKGFAESAAVPEPTGGA